MKLLLLTILAIAAQPAPAKAPRDEVHERVTITAVSDAPPFFSGIFATAIQVTGTSDVGTNDYFIFYLREGQPRPAVGATCTIVFRRFAFSVLVGRNARSVIGGRGIRRFSCDGAEPVSADE